MGSGNIMINKFTILGERCSGTNFLEEAISKNLNVEITWQYGWKHFFGRDNFENSDNVLFLGIAREPISWINSLYREPHHIPNNIRENVTSFLNREFYSEHLVDGRLEEILEDRNFITEKRYKNIFELRSNKLIYLTKNMREKVRNYKFIRYEDLCNKYDFMLRGISEEFKIKTKSNKFYKINYYKKNQKSKFERKPNKEVGANLILNHPDFNLKVERMAGFCLNLKK
jgi:hypothetical protein